MRERRRAYLREGLRGRTAFWALFAAVAVFGIGGAKLGDPRIVVGGVTVTALLVFLAAYTSARRRAAVEFFAELAPQLGLGYTAGGHYVPITPLLSAGDRQRFEHTMEGPLHGKLGGPPCLLGHYTFETRHESENVTVYRPHPFTVCAIDVGAPLVRFRGLYLRPRISALGLDHDWLDRAPRPERVELESVRFNEIYELRHARDQDQLAVRELFSPSLVVSLTENPLRPGFECKGGTLVVFIRGHEESSGRITMLLETARTIARRIAAEEETHFSAAGQMIR